VRLLKRSTTIFISFFFSNSVYFILFFFKISIISNSELTFFFINDFIFSQLQYFTVFFFITLYALFKFTNNFAKYPTDLGFFFTQLYFIALILLTTSNLLNLFLILEVINVLLIYSFLITPVLRGVSTNKTLFQDNWILKSCVYQFILNFFSSIFFFWSYNLLIGLTQSTNFFFLTNIDLGLTQYNTYLSLLYLAFFIKLGVGPWIFFKIEIYQNFNLILIITYTMLYFLIVLFFFFNLFLIYSLPITNLFIISSTLTLLVITITFLTNLFNYFNVYVFFSFSSLAHLIIFIMQLFLVCVVFE
jgi:hypothetical protein